MRGLRSIVVLALGVGLTVAFAAEDLRERPVPGLGGIQQPQAPLGRPPKLTVEQQVAALQQQVKSLQAQVASLQSALQVTKTGLQLQGPSITITGGAVNIVSQGTMALTSGSNLTVKVGSDLAAAVGKNAFVKSAEKLRSPLRRAPRLTAGRILHFLLLRMHPFRAGTT